MPTILVIEDSDGQRAEVRAALEASGLFERVLEANDGIQGLKRLLSGEPDLVLCDLEMPGLDGEKLLRMAGGAGRAVPFLVLTANTDPERRARLLERGASDAITKPYHTADLIARVGLHLKLVRAQRELVEKNEALSRLSRTDALTGLPNRRELDEVLEREFRRSTRYETPFAVAIADIDRFKAVNDEHGHAVGDAVLIEVARSMRRVVRETDCGGRFGGEEFLAILGNNDVAGARIFAERWRGQVEALQVELPAGGTVGATLSIGIAAWTPERSSAAEILERADSALYLAKETGRNRVCLEADDGRN
ncbi:MAG: diguanylate cyclase [bacterium]|nr:diguanylate cyclase [bacterium]